MSAVQLDKLQFVSYSRRRTEQVLRHRDVGCNSESNHSRDAHVLLKNNTGGYTEAQVGEVASNVHMY